MRNLWSQSERLEWDAKGGGRLLFLPEGGKASWTIFRVSPKYILDFPCSVLPQSQGHNPWRCLFRPEALFGRAPFTSKTPYLLCHLQLFWIRDDLEVQRGNAPPPGHPVNGPSRRVLGLPASASPLLCVGQKSAFPRPFLDLSSHVLEGEGLTSTRPRAQEQSHPK